ncbi:MAG: hypothetical protein PHG20_11260 [Geobacteraceae bacterium]|nr:hypothetical protein [Geobacteraceae bacterium]
MKLVTLQFLGLVARLQLQHGLAVFFSELLFHFGSSVRYTGFDLLVGNVFIRDNTEQGSYWEYIARISHDAPQDTAMDILQDSDGFIGFNLGQFHARLNLIAH